MARVLPNQVLHAAPAGVPLLPPSVARLLATESAPPRLVGHLALVHAAARRLLDALARTWPSLVVDRDIALLGAATHDIGKVRVPEELTGEGAAHERAGAELLAARRFPSAVVDIARLHGRPSPDLPIECAIVVVADAVWKGARWPDAEQALASLISARTYAEPWEVFMALDDAIAEAAQDADAWLAWHNAQPASSAG